jgi:hypothetical protein
VGDLRKFQSLFHKGEKQKIFIEAVTCGEGKEELVVKEVWELWGEGKSRKREIAT